MHTYFETHARNFENVFEVPIPKPVSKTYPNPCYTRFIPSICLSKGSFRQLHPYDAFVTSL